MAHSSMFHVMFDIGMKGKNTDRVVLPDVFPEVLYDVVGFIHTGKYPGEDSHR